MINDFNKCGKLRDGSALKDCKMFPVGRTFAALSISPASSFWFCAVFFFFFSFYGALSILPTSSFWFFAAALFCSTVDTFLLSDMRSPNSVQNENCKLSLCRISNFCARCLQSDTGLFGGHLCHLRWQLTLGCSNFTIFVVMWPVLHAKHRFLKMHQRRRNT